jgi:hypothetical protein
MAHEDLLPNGFTHDKPKQSCTICGARPTWYIAGKKEYCENHKAEACAAMKMCRLDRQANVQPWSINGLGIRSEMPSSRLRMDRSTYGTGLTAKQAGEMYE